MKHAPNNVLQRFHRHSFRRFVFRHTKEFKCTQ